ncbi:MAG TPA: glycosyltransferase family 2 protein [Candidatus Acidoferrales bacterium]|jgi:glycosyltransferase involved in cell wall biosynthesis|nr:glycosyltransferase family 2 protein [Candidatus Acidoferrales bacterium]
MMPVPLAASLSLVIPVYQNEPNLERLLSELASLKQRLEGELEVVFVVDGSPDRSLHILRQRLPAAPFPSRLISLSRNFGSFSAIAAGLEAGSGDYFAVLAADLQEPPELIAEFHRILSRRQADIVFGCRARRSDPWLSELFSRLFWWVYGAFIVAEMPKGGIDVFGCTRQVRDCLLSCTEADTNLIALLIWIGFRRMFVPYDRQARTAGKSAWTLRKKLKYSFDSIFNFTDLPIQLLLSVGAGGIAVGTVFACVLIFSKLTGRIPVPGYSAIVLAIIFFGSLTSLGLGIIGQYLWLTLQNARKRPKYIVATAERYPE